MFKITQLFWELHNFKKEVEQYQKKDQKKYIECYWFHKEKGKMFDVDGLKDHLRDNPISDPRSYADLYTIANCIIDLYNDYSENKEPIRFDNKLKYEENRQKFYGTHRIVAIEVSDKNFGYSTYIDVFQQRFETYELLSFYHIAMICSKIVSILSYFGHNELYTSITKKLPEYCDLGVMVVITKEITNKDFGYFFNSKKFSSSSELEKYLRGENTANKKYTTTKSIRQYLDDSFRYGKEKDLFNETRVKKIVQYCYLRGIEISEHVKIRYPDLFQ